MTKAVEILVQAMDLPESDRALLARELMRSLEEGFDPDSQELWMREIRRRSNALHQGRARAGDADRAVARIRSALPPKGSR